MRFLRRASSTCRRVCVGALVCLILHLAPFPAVAEAWSYLDVDGEAVRIYRDAYGAPHIGAQSVRGAFYAMGYVVAEDRLAQFEYNRRYARGTLAAMNGLDPDRPWSDFVHRRDYYTEAERQAQFEALAPENQAVLQHYADGVNAYLAEALADPENMLPKQLWDAGITPAPWSVLDSIAVAQELLRWLGQRGGYELDNLELLNEIGPEAFDEQRPINNPDAPTTIPPGEEGQLSKEPSAASRRIFTRKDWPPLSPEAVSRIRAERDMLERVALDVGFPPGFGSYGGVISPEKSATPHALLLACPYMRFDEPPQVANEIDLHAPGIAMAGPNVASVPCVFFGHNDSIAWTFSSGVSDVVDTYIEELNPSNRDQYWHNGVWMTMASREEIVEVLDQPDLHYTVYRTVHGPVFHFDLENHLAFSWKRTFWNLEMDTFEALLDMARAANLDQWVDAVRRIPVSFNAHYAGIDGNNAFVHTGRYRIPAPGVDPRLPASGTGEEEWQGFLTFSELPQALNPAQGYLASFNNKPAVWWDNGDVGYFTSEHHVSGLYAVLDAFPTFSLEQLTDVPFHTGTHGTYEHMIELAPPFANAQNILSPGQSGFIHRDGIHSPHFYDQEALYLDWQHKPFVYFYDTDHDGLYDQEEAHRGTLSDTPDTDGDGLRDGDEVRDLDLNAAGLQNPFDPLSDDTTGDNAATGPDGVQDGLNDWDGDGASNAAEFIRGSNPLRPDTGAFHSADTNHDWHISITELSRLITFYNAGALHIDPATPDGYAPGPGAQDGPPHDSDYRPEDWAISIPEVSRLITFYNAGGYAVNPDTQDGFAPFTNPSGSV